MQPRLRRPRQARRVPRRGREPRVVRRAVDARRTCSPRSAARTIPPTWPAPSTGARAAGFERLNLDLIYGTPGETLDDWEATLDAALALEPEHVSAYALTVEPGTPLGRAVAAGTRDAPDDDDQADKYELADDRLAAAGPRVVRDLELGPARARSAATTSSTGSGGEYAGIGCAAHGHTGRPAVVERAHARALHRRGAARASRPRPGRDPRRRRAAGRRTLVLGAAHRAAGSSSPGPEADPRWHGRRASTSSSTSGAHRPGTDRAVLTRRGRLLANEVARPRSLASALERRAARRRLALGRIECQWTSTSARPRSCGRSSRSTSRPRSRSARRRSRARRASACRAPPSATR